jgi:RNA polymerase sigma-70 factor, ECF subfamily
MAAHAGGAGASRAEMPRSAPGAPFLAGRQFGSLTPVTSTPLDEESKRWLEELRAGEPVRTKALGRLHAMLLGIARAEANRRRPSLPGDVAADLDDLCTQAANDALAAILGKLDSFRGASRFTTWAYKFAVFEVSVRVRRRAWSTRRVALDEAAWGRLADPAQDVPRTFHEREVLSAVRKAVEETLTEHQRHVFLAAVAEEVPIDVIAERTGSSRGAVYKVIHDARRKLRRALVTAGHLEER